LFFRDFKKNSKLGRIFPLSSIPLQDTKKTLPIVLKEGLFDAEYYAITLTKKIQEKKKSIDEKFPVRGKPPQLFVENKKATERLLFCFLLPLLGSNQGPSD
jgi:hypothetical protein